MSAEILTSMFSELVTVVRSSGRGFATYLADVLKRCKVKPRLNTCLKRPFCGHSEESSINSL